MRTNPAAACMLRIWEPHRPGASSQSALSLSFEAPTNSFALAPFFHTWKVGMALMPQEAATACVSKRL